MVLTAPDLLLVSGRIWTGRGEAEALAVGNGRVAAVGTAEEARGAAGPNAEVIDLGGRRVIPGLIDSHTHFVRAGLSWNDLVRWDDVRSLRDGLERIAAAADRAPEGAWVRVLGGWHPGRFAEGRGPTREELDEAGGGHPVYVQLLYEEGILNTAGIRAVELGLEDLPPEGVERDPTTGSPTGRVRGGHAFTHVLRHIPPAELEDQVASTRALMADFNALGVTAVTDPGGLGVTPETYRALFEVWRRGQSTLRTRLYLVPGERGKELEQVRDWVRHVQPGFGDPWLRYVGMGEILSFGCHDMEGVRPFEVSAAARGELREITLLLLERGWPAHVHAILDSTISAVLDVWEELDRAHGLAGRRFSLAHAEAIGERNLERVAALGIGVAVQNRLMFRSADSAALWGEDVASGAPPLRRLLDLGIPVGAGTDATVVTPHNPWECLWWLVTGRSFDGAPPRRAVHRLSRQEALHLYTSGSAWFSFDEDEQGTLEPGRWADLAVLSDDYFAVPEDEIAALRSELTIAGGRVVHAGAPFSHLRA
jgi:predicted amidohydrolase YtcJ